MYYPFLPGGLAITGYDPSTGMPIISEAQPTAPAYSTQPQTPATGGAGGMQQTTSGTQQNTGGTQQGIPNIPAAPVFNNPWGIQRQPSFVRDAYGNVTPLQPSVTRDSAQQLAGLLGGRLVNQADNWAGPFRRTDSWAIVLPDGGFVDADAAAWLYERAQREYEQARRSYELNRQLNPALFTNGPGFTMPPDPLTVLKTYQWERAPSWVTGESDIIDITQGLLGTGTGTGVGSGTTTGPGTGGGSTGGAGVGSGTTTNTGPSTTSSWYRFHRIDQPLGQWATRREDVMSPGLQQYGTSVFNAQSMGVPLGSPATVVERVAQTGAGAGAGTTGGTAGGTTGGPGQVQMAPRFDQNQASLSDLWQASWSQYGSPSGQSMPASGPASARPDSQHIETPSFLAPWGPARQNRPAYTVQYNPAGSLPF